jgi:cysteine desulfuration protein SufE
VDTVAERARRIVAEFSDLDDPIDRYRRLVELGEGIPMLAEEDRTDANQLPGCQFAVWLRSDYDAGAGVLHFRADSDARITRGLAALLIQLFDGLPPADILAADLDFLDAVGLRDQLSVHRGNGLSALVEEIRNRARKHTTGEQNPA